jgi:diguanylate cyclase (GGDEF)-like protein
MDTVARFGGDEFVVMLSEISADPGESTMHATNVAEKLRAALGEPYSLSVQTSPEAQTAVMHICSASIGVAMFDGSSNDSNELVRLADAAMYVAKDRGKNTVSFAK